ncbi:MAG: alkaline phosphatase family protein [Acidobacteriota bacterium]|jgi:predicted AlkP superfamily phosphohydrolase/phosphomutase|nr:alkaline phosphatase family protein [Acidobacteriota bacterium]
MRWISFFSVLAISVSACGVDDRSYDEGMIVIGIDGMDYALSRKLMDEGHLPNLARLEQMGGFQALGTSVPPQSPVAWSNFITGLDSGGHGIYDFIHRNPETMVPYLSTSKPIEPSRTLKVGNWDIPLSGGGMELLRRGTPFWEVLERHGIPTTIIRMPANFPPSGSAYRELSGMGTPDVLGTPGYYSFYTTMPERITSNTEALIERVQVRDGIVEAELLGPPNPLLIESEELKAPFTVYVDGEYLVAKIVVGQEEFILQQGEWSDWVPVQFEMIPYLQSINATARFFLKEVRPEFELYVSPINLDPIGPLMPISTPVGYAKELAEATGRFYTQGMPEDTNALNEGVFNNADFMTQVAMVHAEIRNQFDYVLNEFQGGFLFYYFGNLDQVSHMMWRAMDPEHPAHDAIADAPYVNAVIDRYVDVDEFIGETLEKLPENTTLVVMSDHGFTSWRRAMNLNTWLLENGYITLINPLRVTGIPYFGNVDWESTQAYAVGLNGVYINLRGREANGYVMPSDQDALSAEIAEKLLSFIDPSTGEKAVTKVYHRDEVFAADGYLDIGPDLIVGFARGVRGSNESALGEFSTEIIFDNNHPWSGDHLMDHEAVPGVLFSSRPLKRVVTSLQNLAGVLLAEFGIEDFPPTPQLPDKQ